MKRKFEEMNDSININIDDNCPICMEKLQDKNITITKCGHKFCHKCLDLHSCSDSKCPMCREDMETKIKVKTICDCDIRYSVSKTLHESTPHLNNLCKRVTKNFLQSVSECNIDNIIEEGENSNLSKEIINDVRNKIIQNLKEDKDFKFNILKDIFQDIAYFTMVNSNCACLNLKQIFESM